MRKKSGRFEYHRLFVVLKKIMASLKCTIERIVFNNPENGYTVMEVSTEDTFGRQTIVGVFEGVQVGMTLKVDGEWRNDRRFGQQFAVESWMEDLPATIKGIEAYLASGFIKGIGKKKAKAIVKVFGEQTIEVLDNTPERLVEVSGISKVLAEKITKSWLEHKKIRDVMVFLQGHGISTAYAVRIYKQYGDDSIQVVKENPYVLADDVFGIGFKMADSFAFHLGYEKNDIRRCKAGIVYTLKQLANDGHCYAEQDKLLDAARVLLEIDAEPIQEALNLLIFDESVVNDEGNIFLPMYFYSEMGVSGKIKSLIAEAKKEQPTIVDIDAISRETKMDYDEVQKEAIQVAVNSKFMVLTGGPGTGKTTTTQGIIAALESQHKTILCAAPTGRAAKRMSEATGKDAQTIHRLLEYNPERGFGRNEDNKLGGDVLIVDESSMIDILLMNALLKAVPSKMSVILVGDIDQLPSVGAGNVLRDIIDSGVVSVIRLTRIFRQAQTSRIVTNAHKINHGESPDLSNGKDTDFFFIKNEDAEGTAKTIVDLVSSRLPNAYGYNTNDIQVLVPMKNGATGTISLNNALQNVLNPVGEAITCGQYKFRSGDKVMQIKNDYDNNVFNGDVGVIESVDTDERKMVVSFDNRPVEYESGDISNLTLAYACTIHKSQGSEYPVVVMPLLMSHFVMLQRNLVYTGVTRAKKQCVIVGDTRAVGYAVKNMVVLKRNTMLKERLQTNA